MACNIAQMTRNDNIHVTTELEYSKLTYDQIWQREFFVVEDAESFYREYARQVGLHLYKYNQTKSTPSW